jgi:hypothetical protein
MNAKEAKRMFLNPWDRKKMFQAGAQLCQADFQYATLCYPTRGNMEEDLYISLMVDDLNFFKWKTTAILIYATQEADFRYATLF